EPTVLRVVLEEEPIVEVERARCARTVERKTEGDVLPVRGGDDLVIGPPRRARLTVGLHPESREGVAVDVGEACPELAPGDRPAAVAIEAERVVEIAEGDVPAR